MNAEETLSEIRRMTQEIDDMAEQMGDYWAKGRVCA